MNEKGEFLSRLEVSRLANNMLRDHCSLCIDPFSGRPLLPGFLPRRCLFPVIQAISRLDLRRQRFTNETHRAPTDTTNMWHREMLAVVKQTPVVRDREDLQIQEWFPYVRSSHL